jgi:hypothetical protein
LHIRHTPADSQAAIQILIRFFLFLGPEELCLIMRLSSRLKNTSEKVLLKQNSMYEEVDLIVAQDLKGVIKLSLDTKIRERNAAQARAWASSTRLMINYFGVVPVPSVDPVTAAAVATFKLSAAMVGQSSLESAMGKLVVGKNVVRSHFNRYTQALRTTAQSFQKLIEPEDEKKEQSETGQLRLKPA